MIDLYNAIENHWGAEVDKALSKACTVKCDDYAYDAEALQLTIINMKRVAVKNRHQLKN